MTYREEKEMLRRRFPFCINGKFEDGTDVAEKQIHDILADAEKSVTIIIETARQHLRIGETEW